MVKLSLLVLITKECIQINKIAINNIKVLCAGKGHIVTKENLAI